MRKVILLVLVLTLSAGCSRISGLLQEPSKNEGFSESLGSDIQLDMVWIPAGSFQMGSPDSELQRESREGPVHSVELDGFWMGKYEVTQEQYEAVMGTNPVGKKSANHPVSYVSWSDALEFCGKLSAKTGRVFRLPTEAEWEYACRAGTTTPFYFGETISTSQANYNGKYAYGEGKKGEVRGKSVEVGSFPPNKFGLYNMHGNVLEWCQDWYYVDYYAFSPKKNPQGPSKGTTRVVRSGSWFLAPRKFSRSAARNGYSPSAHSYVGFRVVVSSFPR